MFLFVVEFPINAPDGQCNCSFIKDSLILLPMYPSIYSSRYPERKMIVNHHFLVSGRREPRILLSLPILSWGEPLHALRTYVGGWYYVSSQINSKFLYLSPV